MPPREFAWRRSCGPRTHTTTTYVGRSVPPAGAQLLSSWDETYYGMERIITGREPPRLPTGMVSVRGYYTEGGPPYRRRNYYVCVGAPIHRDVELVGGEHLLENGEKVEVTVGAEADRTQIYVRNVDGLPLIRRVSNDGPAPREYVHVRGFWGFSDEEQAALDGHVPNGN